jgi:hypothetical protein
VGVMNGKWLKGRGIRVGVGRVWHAWNKRKRIRLVIPRNWIYDRTAENTCTTGLEESLDSEAR